jgi:hypothetical protein
MKKNGNATVTSDTAASAVKGRQAAALKHQILAPFLESPSKARTPLNAI